MIATIHAQLSRKLIGFGVLLVALAVCTTVFLSGWESTEIASPPYQQDLLNGIFLVSLGAVWPKLTLSNESQRWAYRLVVFGTYMHWIINLSATILTAGLDLLPFAGASFERQFWNDLLLQTGFICFSLTTLITCGIVLWGLRGSSKK